MAIKTRYRWDSDDYRSLINVCKQANQYRYGRLLQEDPGREPRGTVVVPVPEGWVVLAQKESYPRAFKFTLQDLERDPVELTPLVVKYLPDRNRACLLASKSFLRSKQYLVHDLSHRAHYFKQGDSKPLKVRKSQGEYFKTINLITRELIGLKRWIWIPLPSQKAYDRAVKGYALEYLTSVLHLDRKKAGEAVKRFLVPLEYKKSMT